MLLQHSKRYSGMSNMKVFPMASDSYTSMSSFKMSTVSREKSKTIFLLGISSPASTAGPKDLDMGVRLSKMVAQEVLDGSF